MENLHRIILGIALLGAGWGCYHFGYVHGYEDALAWAKGVVWD